MKRSQLKAIIVDERQPELLLVEKLPEDVESYRLPGMLLPLGLDPVIELKHELSSDYPFLLTFRRILPNTWSQLIFLHTRTIPTLTTYYVLTTDLASQLKRQRANAQYSILNLTTTTNHKIFDKEDAAALEMYNMP